MLHFAGHPTRVGSQEFTDNVFGQLGSSHESSAKAQVDDRSLRALDCPTGTRRFRHTDLACKAVEVECNDALL
jgi:hypothetical protein